MIDKILRGAISLVGLLIGVGIVTGFEALGVLNLPSKGWISLVVYAIVGIAFGIIFFLLAPKFIKGGRKSIQFFEAELQKMPAYEIALGSIGLIVGLIIAYLLSQPFYNLGIPYLGVIISIFLYAIFGYLGIKVPTRKKEDFSNAIGNFKKVIIKIE